MSTDSTATSDASDPGSPFSHTSTCTDDVSAGQKIPTSPNVSPQNGKALKRQAQVTEKCDKKRVRKELCSKNNNVEIKLIPMTPAQPLSPMKKPNLIKSTLSAITSLNVFKTQQNGKSQPPPIAISSQQPPNLAQLSTTSQIATTISKLTDYYKLKKEVPSTLNMEKYCNMLLSLQTAGKQNVKQTNVTKHAATTITPIINTVQQLKTPTKPVNVPKKPVNEKKTAKIAPIIPVARKTPTNQASMQQHSSPQLLKISPKKPVSIAPRIEPRPSPNKNSILQPKPVPMAVNNIKPATNGKLVATSTSSQVQQNQQPTMLLAAIRIPSQQMQAPTQPPPLKMQNGLMQKTTTTTTTKLQPLLQFHAQQMIPNLIQLPNLIATNKQKVASSQPQQPQQQNLYVNSSSLTQQQQQQLFMNGAVIKLQSIPVSSQSNPQTMTSSTMTNVTAMNNAAHKYALQQQQQQAFAAQIAAQQMQQLFMTTPVLFNTSSLPTVLSSQLAGLQHAFNQQQIASSMAPPCSMPALQPIQSSLLSSYSTSSMTSTTNSMQLPSISTILHNGINQQQYQLQHHHQIPTLMKTSMAPTFASLPPSLTITSGFMQNQQRINVSTPPQATVNPSPKAIPPLAPASNLPLNIAKNLPKLVSVTSSSSQTSPKSPPPLVMNQKVQLPQGSPIVTLPPATIKQDHVESKPNAICVVPPLPSPAKVIKVEVENEEKVTITEASKDTKSAISIFVEEKLSIIECAKSPILSQPKTIRFPPVNGKVTVWKKCVKISKTGVCNWEKCSKHFDSNSDLLDHLHQGHINAQVGPFMCSWRDCKVNGREGSKGWLERHVMSHVGSKPFRCIVERCGLRFSTQVRLKSTTRQSFFFNVSFLTRRCNWRNMSTDISTTPTSRVQANARQIRRHRRKSKRIKRRQKSDDSRGPVSSALRIIIKNSHAGNAEGMNEGVDNRGLFYGNFLKAFSADHHHPT